MGRKQPSGNGKGGTQKPCDPTEVELQLIKAVADFHGGHVKAMQLLIKRLEKAKKDHGPIFQSPGGRDIGKHIVAVSDLSTEINRRLAALMTRICAEYRLPATARRAMTRAVKTVAPGLGGKRGRAD